MRLPFRSLGTFVLLILLLAGCARTRSATTGPFSDLPNQFPNHSLPEVLGNIQQMPDTLFAFSAKANVSIKTPIQSGNFSSDLRHRKNDSLYMSVKPLLGVVVARTLVTPDSFYVYDRLKRKLILGALDDASGLLPPGFTNADVFPNLLGLVAPNPSVRWHLEADSLFYVLTTPNERFRYTIDPSIWRVVRFEERSSAGDLIEERMFSNFDVIEGIPMPRRVALRRPFDETAASFYYKRINLNPNTLSFDLKVRDNVERVYADQW